MMVKQLETKKITIGVLLITTKLIFQTLNYLYLYKNMFTS